VKFVLKQLLADINVSSCFCTNMNCKCGRSIMVITIITIITKATIFKVNDCEGGITGRVQNCGEVALNSHIMTNI